MFFHYLKAYRKKLQNEHLTKKINKEIYHKFMETFIDYTFKELSKIENKYKL